MQLTADQNAIRSLARDFARAELAPYAAQWDRDASFPMAAIRKMADVGLLGMTAPERFGGSEADTVALVTTIEEIARGDASCALVLSMANSLSILSLMTFGTAAQQAQWMPQIVSGECIACFTLTEPHAGSNPTAMKTVAERKGTSTPPRQMAAGKQDLVESNGSTVECLAPSPPRTRSFEAPAFQR